MREVIVEWGLRGLRAIRRAILRFVEWLFDLFPKTGLPAEGGGGITAAVLIVVGMILALLAAVAVFSFSRSRRPVATAVGRPGRAEDEDPAARTVSGWEQRAQELAAEGRHREAIRAWYHAVLARCVAAGVLHLRRGRTNWEYAFTLAPSLPWRARFEDLTRRFDLEWYGRTESTGEALAAFSDGASGILRALGPRS